MVLQNVRRVESGEAVGQVDAPARGDGGVPGGEPGRALVGVVGVAGEEVDQATVERLAVVRQRRRKGRIRARMLCSSRVISAPAVR